MSDFIDRLERELLASGRRSRTGRAARRVGRTAFSGAPAVVSMSVVAVIVAVVVVTAVNHQTATGVHHRPAGGAVATAGSAAATCKIKTVGKRLVPQPLVQTDTAPSNALLSILGSLRRPATTVDRIDLRKINRWPYEVITIYKRYIRVHAGEDGARLAIIPAMVCSLPQASIQHPVAPKPTEVLLMQVLSNPGPLPTILVGTSSDIEAAQANPGLDYASPRGWLQATVVPDGVARVVMHFTPPFRHHYTVTMSIHDNVGIAIRKPDYTPTSVRWYGANGNLLRTYIDRQALNADNCLASHKKNC